MQIQQFYQYAQLVVSFQQDIIVANIMTMVYGLRTKRLLFLDV